MRNADATSGTLTPDERERLWRRWRLQAELAVAFAAGGIVAAWTAWFVWMICTWVAAQLFLPQVWAGVIGLGVALLVGLAIWRRRRRVLLRTVVDDVTAAAVDWRLGVGAAGTVAAATRFWLRQRRRAVGDPWRLGVAAAVLFAVGLNTWSAWGPAVWALLTGEETVYTVTDPLVEIRRFGYRERDGGGRTLAPADGFARVPEGARLTWRVVPVRPGRALVLATAGGNRVRLPVTAGTTAFAITVTQPLHYRFELERWGARLVERGWRRIEVEPDLPPTIRWAPPPPAAVTVGEPFRFGWWAEDDHAVTSVVLWVTARRAVRRLALPVSAAAPRLRGGFVLDPRRLPRAREVVLTLAAADDDPWDGPNLGRSVPVIVTVEDWRTQHDRWRAQLAVLRRRGTVALADDLERVDRRTLPRRYRELAASASRLAEQARELEVVGVGADRELETIAAHWHRAADQRVTEAEEALWRLDRLIGREAAARIEATEDQLLARLDEMLSQVEQGDLSGLEQLLWELETDLRQLAEVAREHRPSLPRELIHTDALEPLNQERRDLIQALREALRRGDREAARELLQRLLKQLRQGRRQLQSGAASWSDGLRARRRAAEAAAQELGELARRQAELAERFARASRVEGRGAPRSDARPDETRRLDELAAEQRRLAERVGRARARFGQEFPRLDTPLERGTEAAHLAAQRGRERQPGAAADAALEAARSLERAARAAREEAEELARLQRQPGFADHEREGAEGKEFGDVRFESPRPTPPPTGRAQILERFRSGIPEPGRDVNRRYLERLLR